MNPLETWIKAAEKGKLSGIGSNHRPLTGLEIELATEIIII